MAQPVPPAPRVLEPPSEEAAADSDTEMNEQDFATLEKLAGFKQLKAACELIAKHILPAAILTQWRENMARSHLIHTLFLYGFLPYTEDGDGDTAPPART